jgi:hypothetical protein
MLQEATELIPAATLHTSIPFVSGEDVDSNSDTQLSEDGHIIWRQTPAAVDLIFWQGDDIVIPFYFNDPAVLSDDMALNYVWYAQIRRWHNYRSSLIGDFVTKAVYHPGATEADEYTMVECFLPRTENVYSGCFRWELYSIALEDWSRFPKPDDVDVADWPPPDALRTWLWGRCYIVPARDGHRRTPGRPDPAPLWRLHGSGHHNAGLGRRPEREGAMSSVDVVVSKGAPNIVTVGPRTPVNVTAGTTGPTGPPGPSGSRRWHAGGGCGLRRLASRQPPARHPSTSDSPRKETPWVPSPTPMSLRSSSSPLVRRRRSSPRRR